MNILGLFVAVFGGLIITKGVLDMSDMACAIGAVIGGGSYILLQLS